MSPLTTRRLAACGIAGPVLFAAAWILAAAVQPRYSVRREDISALAAGTADHPWIMISGFVLMGALTAPYAVGLRDRLPNRAASTAGAVLLGLAGVALLAAGLFRNDCSSMTAACRARVDAGAVSWHHTAHELVSVVVFLSLILAPLILARSFGADAHWRDLRVYSVLTGLATLVLLILFGGEVFSEWNGVVQRFLVTVSFLWIAITALRLWRVTAHDPAAAGDVKAS